MTGVAVPRVLARIWFRRPKPRPPGWWSCLRWFLVAVLLAVLSVVATLPLLAAAELLLAGYFWRDLWRWPEDSLRGPPSDALGLTLVMAAVALCIAGFVA